MLSQLRRLAAYGSWLALAGLIAALLVVASWCLHGGRVYSVPTGSMRPVIQPGDAVFIRRTSYAQLQVGQVVSYRDRSQPWLITTHRIVELDRASGRLTTKGDHNPEPDLPISQGQVIGQATMVGPHLGQLLAWLRRPAGLLLAVYLPVITVVYIETERYVNHRAIYYGR